MLRPDSFGFGGRAAALAGMLLLAAVTSADPGVEVDVSQGVVDGYQALSFWVVKGFGSREVIDPAGFVVKMVPATDLDSVLTEPAGEWFAPRPGKYKFWLEGPGWITPYSSVFNYHRKFFQGKGIAAVVPVEPAGTVALATDVPASPSTILRWLHLDSHNRAPYPQRELSRSVVGEAMYQGVLMPAGPVVAALVDSKNQQYLALSRPVEVKRDASVEARPKAPRPPSTDLLVRLERPGFVTDYENYDVELVVRNQDGTSRKPDVSIPTTDRLYAIWYALGEGRISLEARSAKVFLPAETIVLRPGKVESFRGTLRPLPDIEVRLELPYSLSSSKNLKLEVVLDRPSHTRVRELELPPGTDSFLLEDVVAQPVEVLLHAPPWIFHRPVDLSDGQQKTVIFDPAPITVTGTVYRGDRGQPATVEFQTTRQGDTLTVKTDTEGFYETQLFRAGYYIVSVRLDGYKGVAHFEMLDRPLREDTTLDFLLPDNRFVVRVVDANSRQGIEGAEVAVGNSYASMGGPLRTPGVEKHTVLKIVTDRHGKAEMQPLHPGKLTLSALAESHMPSGVIEETVREGDPGREIMIDLRRVDASTRLRLQLPDGRPAAGAEVRIQNSLGNAKPSWSGTADADGRVELAFTGSEAWVLARHALGGYLIRPMPAPDSEPVSWTLTTAVTPLAVEVRRPWGQPARWARLALWIDDRCVFGQTLAWLAGAQIATDGEGFWQARGLPATPFKILAWSPDQDVNPPALETLAVKVSYPWQDVVAIETFD